MTIANETLLTAEEFLRLAPDVSPDHCGLLGAKVVEMNFPLHRHGQVCIVDPEQQSIHVFHLDGMNAVLHDTDTRILPTVLPCFEMPIQEFFG